MATLPNVLFGPFAGTLVDRWEHKEVMIVSDLLRAAVILLIPIAVTINVLLVYPLVFTVTTISIFFRPARVAILPRIVDEEDLLTGNSALWIAEVAADVIGYPWPPCSWRPSARPCRSRSGSTPPRTSGRRCS